MGLSDREQRILEELESQLAADDPSLARRATNFANAAGGSRSLLRSIGLFVVGVVLLLLLTFNPLFGIAGAALMLVGLVQGARAAGVYAREQVSARASNGSSDGD